MSQPEFKVLLNLKIDPENGCYIGRDGCHYDTAEDVIRFDILKFCGCGCPDLAMSLVRDVLQILHDRSTDNSNGVDKLLEHTKRLDDVLKSEEIKYFVLYMLDHLGLEEHGSSTPGWLTEKGEDVLHDLNILLKKK